MDNTTNPSHPSQEEFDLMQAELEESIAGAFKLGLELVKGDETLSLMKIAIYLIVMDRSLREAFKNDEKAYNDLIKITSSLLKDNVFSKKNEKN